MINTKVYILEKNSMNIFLVADIGTLVTLPVDYCLPGITRIMILLLAKEINITTYVSCISLPEFHYADEVFTMGELTPVTIIFRRVIGMGKQGKTTVRFQDVYKESVLTQLDWSTKIPLEWCTCMEDQSLGGVEYHGQLLCPWRSKVNLPICLNVRP